MAVSLSIHAVFIENTQFAPDTELGARSLWSRGADKRQHLPVMTRSSKCHDKVYMGLYRAHRTRVSEPDPRKSGVGQVFAVSREVRRKGMAGRWKSAKAEKQGVFRELPKICGRKEGEGRMQVPDHEGS